MTEKAIFEINWEPAIAAMRGLGEALARVESKIAERRASVLRVPYEHGTLAYKAAFDAAFPGLPECMTQAEAERRLTAALIAYDGVNVTEDAER